MSISAAELTDVLRERSGIDAVLIGDGSVALAASTHDSRAVERETLFCCVPGERHDGHDFADAAIAAGAVALLVERRLQTTDASTQIVVPSVREAMGPASSVVHGDPSAALSVIGVTGTNGKTSVVHLLGSVLGRLGVSTEVVGTLTGSRTTPEGTDLQATLAAARDRAVRCVALEVSSHALALHRVDGTRFAAAIFTNLGHDHLDFHHTIEEYFAAKARLFTSAFTDVSVINLDDPAGRRIADMTDTPVIGYGIGDAGDLTFDGPTSNFDWRGRSIVLRLAGEHNVLNALAVAAVAEHLGHEPDAIADALCAADAPRGRFEFVNVGQDFHVVVDYAHKPEALASVLRAARGVAGDHRVIVAVGCGGDRDREKRPMMAVAAVENADRAIFTSDNPRSESPQAIIDEMLAGLDESQRDSVAIELDRGAAIGLAIEEASTGDVVVIAGKGHEDYQVIGDVVVDFDDRAVAAAFLVEALR